VSESRVPVARLEVSSSVGDAFRGPRVAPLEADYSSFRSTKHFR
jgi:hypothetical protein